VSAYISYPDAILTDLLKTDDEAAFNEIFNRYDRLLFIYAYKKLQDKEEAKDVVQDVFINLWSVRKNLGLTGELNVYLYACVRNRALNLLRSKNNMDKYIGSLQSFMEDNKDADYLIREKDISSLIEKEIAALPPKMREVFELRRKEYLKNKEIAQRLNISEQTVATHIKRALKILRVKLGLMLYLSILLLH
jgi:RNA polymerase sigma-70 factor (ECF subfamily)